MFKLPSRSSFANTSRRIVTNRNQAKSRGRKSRTLSRLIFAVVVFVVFYLIDQLTLEHLADPYEDSLFDLKPLPDAYFNNVPVRLRSSSGAVKNLENGAHHEPFTPSSFHSSVHCVGETHDPSTAWKHRSCSYVHLCLDLGHSEQGSSGETKPPEFFLVASKSDRDFHARFREASPPFGKHRYSSTEILGFEGNSGGSNNNSTQSTTPRYSPIDVALGGINPSWRAPPKPRVPYEHGIDKIRWKPRVYDAMPFDKYYELDPGVVMVPYHSFAGANVGHLLWDDFLPIYNLLKIFGYDTNLRTAPNNGEGETVYQHLLIRVDTMPGLYGTCDLRWRKKEACRRNLERFLPLFGVDPSTFSTLTGARLTTSKPSADSEIPPERYPVCAKRAVAGLGWLTDHGIRNHGWMANHEENLLDVALARNVGRGPELYAFRNFLLRNAGFETSAATPLAAVSDAPENARGRNVVSFRILLSAHSSNHPDRSFGLQAQKTALVGAFPDAEISILDLSRMTLLEQIALVSDQPATRPGTKAADGQPPLLRATTPRHRKPTTHSIFVSACGGGSFTAYFLPRGSSLVLYYNATGGMDYFANEHRTGGPALLDWDLMNNLGYLRVQWLPIASMDEPEGLDGLISLIEHEMDGVLNGL